MTWFLVVIIFLLWTVMMIVLGGAVEKDRATKAGLYQDGKPIQTFNYSIPISDEEATDKARLDVLWEFYTGDTWKKHTWGDGDPNA